MKKFILLCLLVSITYSKDLFRIAKPYEKGDTSFTTIGVKALAGHNDEFAAFQTKLIELLKKSNKFSEVKSFSIVSDSLNKIMVMKIDRKKEFRTYVPSSAGQQVDGFCPDLLLLIKRTELKKKHYDGASIDPYNNYNNGSTGFNFPFKKEGPQTETANIATRYVLWNNTKGDVMAFGEENEKKLTYGSDLESDDLDDLAEKLAESIVKNILLVFSSGKKK